MHPNQGLLWVKGIHMSCFLHPAASLECKSQGPPVPPAERQPSTNANVVHDANASLNTPTHRSFCWTFHHHKRGYALQMRSCFCGNPPICLRFMQRSLAPSRMTIVFMLAGHLQ